MSWRRGVGLAGLVCTLVLWAEWMGGCSGEGSSPLKAVAEGTPHGGSVPTDPAPPASAQAGTIAIEVAFAPWPGAAAKATEVEAITQVTAYVYSAAGAELKRQDLTMSGGRASGQVTVVAQNDLRVVLVYLDGALVRWLGKQTGVSVTSHDTTSVTIAADYMGVAVAGPTTSGVGQAYQLSWTRRPEATRYELEESQTSSFAGSSTRYAGTDTTATIVGKGASGTYYYRARANTAYGLGPWFSRGWAQVAIGTSEGSVDIGTDLPPDEPPEVAGPSVGDSLVVALTDAVSMVFLWVPAGTFTMGSPALEVGRMTDEGPQHEVTISKGFWLGKYEITSKQWQAIIANGDPVTARPATNKSWNAVQLFIAYMNQNAGQVLYRLPTEAEWEYACRAGTSTVYPSGNLVATLAPYAVYGGSYSDASTVGQRRPNAWGLFDMVGNATEWCQDWYGSYTAQTQVDPTGPATGSRRVYRGGNINSGAEDVRAARRYSAGVDAVASNQNQGARLVRVR